VLKLKIKTCTYIPNVPPGVHILLKHALTTLYYYRYETAVFYIYILYDIAASVFMCCTTIHRMCFDFHFNILAPF